MNQKIFPDWVFSILSLTAIVAVVIWGGDIVDLIPRKGAKVKVPEKDIVTEMAARHGASTAWDELRYYPGRNIYTTDAVGLLRVSNQAPVLVRGSLFDLADRDSNHIAVFKIAGPANLRAELDCRPEVLSTLAPPPLSNSVFGNVEFALVVKFSQVRKQSSPDEYEDGSFRARGECLDAMPLPASR